jgi:DNA-binding phage protein
MAKKLYDYDPADALTSEEAIEAFRTDAIETGDMEYIAKAMAVVTAARKSAAAKITSRFRAPRRTR